jgi:hypothetical protein
MGILKVKPYPPEPEPKRRATFSPIIVSVVQSASDTQTRELSVDKILQAIRTGGNRLKGQITQIRNRFEAELVFTQGDLRKAKHAVEELKKALPGVMWSGRFKNREQPVSEKLLDHSGLLCTDLDSLGERLPEIRKQLEESRHVFALFLSPTGGLKLVVRVPADASKHLGSFRAAEKHVKELTGIQVDPACKDVGRLCFLSYDPQLYVNFDAVELKPLPAAEKPERPQPFRSSDKPSKAQIREMLSFIPKRPDYSDWIRIVAAVGDALELDDAVQVLDEWSPEEEPGEYLKKLQSGFEKVRIGTLIQLAKQHGWEPKKSEQPSTSAQRDDGEWATDLSSFTSLDEARFPAPLEADAFYGLAGKIVQRILPETEADPAALLFTLLTGFGNMIGRSAYMMADGARHHLNLFSVTVGRTSISRKRTAWVRIKPVLGLIDDDWVKHNVEQGLSSGEGVVHRVRDKIDEEKPVKEKGKWTGNYETVTVDPGIDDKRLFVLETEFCSPLKVMNREGSTLSPVLRAAWDGDDLGTLTKNSRERATEPHVSMIGHITREELRRNLNETEAANGFGNRILWNAAKRSKSLPQGGQIPPIADFLDPLQDALLHAHTCGELKRDDEAEELWAQVYSELSEGKPGLFGAIIGRAAPQVLRISGLYAVLDCSSVVRVAHLKAALACWRYAENSARWIFEAGTGNKFADRILAALIAAGETGLLKWQIVHDVFNRNVTKFTIDEALRLLHHLNVAEPKMESTKGRPAERWFYKCLTTKTTNTTKAE